MASILSTTSGMCSPVCPPPQTGPPLNSPRKTGRRTAPLPASRLTIASRRSAELRHLRSEAVNAVRRMNLTMNSHICFPIPLLRMLEKQSAKSLCLLTIKKPYQRPQSPHPVCFWHPRLLHSRSARSADGTGFGGPASN